MKPTIPDNKIAAITDGRQRLFFEAFREMEQFSNRYISEMLKIHGYPASYPWPIDNLHNWSRWWEYSFVWLHVKPFTGKGVTVLDIGSALTFFPFFLADKGFDVIVIDKDERIEQWADRVLSMLTCLTPQVKQKLKFTAGDITTTRFEKNSFDVITNISVIEHIPDKHVAIKEIHRLLKPGGKLINTLDISLDGKPIGDSQPLLPQESYEFIQTLENVFETKIQFGFIHPMDIVTPGKHPKKYTDRSLYISKFHTIRQMWKLLTSRISVNFLFNPDRLDMWTVAGIALQKLSIKR